MSLRGLTAGLPLFILMVIGAAALVAGVFIVVPLASKNIFFLLAIPFAFAFLMFMAIRPVSTFVLLISVRSMLDLLLVHTRVDVGTSETGIGGILNLLIVVLGLLLVYQNMAQMPRLFPMVRFWVFFLLIGTVSIAFSPDAVKSFKAVMQQTAFMLMFLIPFFLVKTEKDKKFWLKVLFFSSLLPVGLANAGFVTHHRLLNVITVDAGMRLQGSFTHPNILAFYIELILVLCFYILKARCFKLNFIQRSLILAYMLNLAVLIIATKTRSALLAAWLVFALYGVLKEKRYLVIAVLLAGSLMMTPQVQERFSTLGKATSRAERGKNSLEWRMRLWSASMPLVKQRPIFGRGLASFKILSPEFFMVDAQGTLPHNVYVQLLFETGILGVFFYITIFLQLLGRFYAFVRRKLSRVSAEAAVMVSYLVGHLICCFSDNILDYVAFNWYFFFFVGLATRSLYLPDPTEPLPPAAAEAETA